MPAPVFLRPHDLVRVHLEIEERPAIGVLDTRWNRPGTKKWVAYVADEDVRVKPYYVSTFGTMVAGASTTLAGRKDPSIRALPDGEMSLVTVDFTTEAVYLARWTDFNTEKYVETVVAGDATVPDHVIDTATGNTVVVFYDTVAEQFYVKVGVLNSGGASHTWSAAVSMVLADPAETRGSLEQLPSGSYQFTFADNSDNIQIVTCRQLSSSGAGTWS